MQKLQATDFLVGQLWKVIESVRPEEQGAVVPSLIEVLGEVLAANKRDDESLVRPDGAKLKQICSDLLAVCVRVGDESWDGILANDLRRLEKEICGILGVEPFNRPLVWADVMDPPKQAGHL
jgi:hypothetical protein